MGRRGVVLVKTSNGKVRTDLPDGRTVYLDEADALQVIAERFALKEGVSVEQAKEVLGI